MNNLEALRLIEQAARLLEPKRHLSLSGVALRLDCSPKWVREHLAEFPGAWRMPGGEIRVPARDVEALAASRRCFSKEKLAA
jgi:hypothetical protein